MVTKEK